MTFLSQFLVFYLDFIYKGWNLIIGKCDKYVIVIKMACYNEVADIMEEEFNIALGLL